MTTTDFIFNIPLYQKVTDGVDQIANDLEDEYSAYGSHATFDGYNPIQKKESTYCVYLPLANRQDIWYQRSRFSVFKESNIQFCTLKCLRYGDKIELCLWIDASDHSITKVGQYPSVATIHIGQIRQYTSVLSKEDLKEFLKGGEWRRYRVICVHAAHL